MFSFLNAFLPISAQAETSVDDVEAIMDIRFIMKHWNCTDARILQTTAIPDAGIAAQDPGVPVGLLPLVLQEVPIPDPKDAHFRLHATANIMLCEFWAAVELFKEMGKDATLAQFSEPMCSSFIPAAKAFAMEYVRLTHPNAQEIQTALDNVIPLAVQLQQDGNPEFVHIYNKIKTLFFGLNGFPLTQAILEQMQEAYAVRLMQNATLEEAARH